MTTKQTHPITRPIQLIYAGGTFGSYGKPLLSLSADTFIPLLLHTISLHQHPTYLKHINIISNDWVKDSSQLTPVDIVTFYRLILDSYSLGNRQFVIITGTDTLAYLAAFLAEAFAGSDINLVITGSMRPLFDPDNISDYVIDSNSDAWGNLKDALATASFADSGVRITFSGETWPAQTVQKIHSHDLMAFTGHSRAGYPANSYVKLLKPEGRKHWLEDQYTRLDRLKNSVNNIQIPILYCVPNIADYFIKQLECYISLPPTGIILIGFGAGNIPYSDALAHTMDQAFASGHMLVCTTQCPFGGVSNAYAAGSWQYEHHVISGGRLTIAAIYARLLWLHLTQETPARRRYRWTYATNQTDIAPNKFKSHSHHIQNND